MAEGEGPDGKAVSYSVFKKGFKYYISGPNSMEHLCNRAVSDIEGIKREIFIVYRSKITKIKMPWELNTR